MDYGKLKFEHISGDDSGSVADNLHDALCRLNGGTYFRNDDTLEYDYIPPDRTYRALGAWPAIDGIILVYIDERYCDNEIPDPYKLAYAMYNGTDPDTGIIYKKMPYYGLIHYGLCPTWRDAIENGVEECPTPSTGEVGWLPNSEWHF